MEPVQGSHSYFKAILIGHMKKEPFFVFAIGMCLGWISHNIFLHYSLALGILGYFITIMIVLAMTFNDKSNE